LGKERPGVYAKYRNYKVDENYFEIWSHNMAYILGLWFADGCITGNEFRIALHENDKYLLEKISKEIGSEHKLVPNNGCFQISICSKKIVQDIIKLGGKYRKSLDVKFPHVPKKYLPDFIRGLWDGDGCVFISNGAYNSNIVSGSKNFIDSLFKILRNNIYGIKGSVFKNVNPAGYKIMGRTIEKTSLTYYLHFSKNDTIRLRDFMYNTNSDLKMIRKYEKFQMAGNITRLREYGDELMCFEKAVTFVRKLKLKSIPEWRDYCKNKKEIYTIPASPNTIYKNKGWLGWSHWLGYNKEDSYVYSR
jgi:hypothetical protein